MTARLNLLLLVFILLTACCKKKEPCHSCPLSDGSYCPNGMINVFNNCQCPEGSFWFMNTCVSQNDVGVFFGDLNCKCLGEIGIKPSDTGVSISVMVNGIKKSFATALEGNAQEFDLWLVFPEFSCDQLPNPNAPKLVGKVIDDTLNMKVYWHEFGPNFQTPIDSCVNIKLAPAWKP
jgi:hypothetical protein